MKNPTHASILALSLMTMGVLFSNCASKHSHSTQEDIKTEQSNATLSVAVSPYADQELHEEIAYAQPHSEKRKVQAAETMQIQSAPAMYDQVYIQPVPTQLPTDSITIAENPKHELKITNEEPVSTFSVDVDTASFSQIKQYLDMGRLPPKDLVRTEEVINYFDYNYSVPSSINNPISLNANLMRHPFESDKHLLQLGLQAFEVEQDELPPMNLVLLIDVSGSMHSQDKLPLLVRGMEVLIDQLDEEDRVSIVTYAGRSAVLANAVSGDQKQELYRIFNSLNAGGSTHGSAGIEQAYNIASENFIENGVNRVVLATDGDFNVGLTNITALKEFVSNKANDQIYLSAIGFGHAGYHDSIMEEISNKGEGNAYFINDYNQARKVFAQQLPSMALSVAADVKVQVEFNPNYVSEYRLIGYNNRRLNREDFNNDEIDAAEMGAGHNVTAIYEVVLAGDKPSVDPLRYQENTQIDLQDNALKDNEHSEIAFFKARYKQDLVEASKKISLPIFNTKLDLIPDHLILATSAMQFAENLRSSDTKKSDYQQILDWLNKIKNPNEEVAELKNMIHNAKSLTKY